MLEVKKLSKKFGDKIAVDNVSFTVNEGRIFGFLGRNGAGKSTIFRMILNILTPNSGTIKYNDKKIDNTLTDSIGYLPEEGSLILTYTVLEQCMYYGALKSMTEEEVRRELFKWLKKFDILEYMNMKLKELSKGNRQKIQFIIAILHSPKLLILDEPFSGLDPVSVEQLKQVIVELKEEGRIIVFSSHRMDHVEMICEDILILDHGVTLISGDLEDIKKSYNKQTLKISGIISNDVLEQIANLEDVISIQKNDVDNYVIKTLDEECIGEIFTLLKNSKIINFSTSQISLNDIFIDKVGSKYEE